MANPISQALGKVLQNLRDTRRAFQRGMAGRQGRARLDALAGLQRLRSLPGPPRYPIRWKTDKQRRAFFASDGFGRGIPTRRTGAIAKEWRIVYSPSAREADQIILSNPNPAARFVQGADQQPFHADTGWVTVMDVQEDLYAQIGDVVIDVFVSECDPLRGV